MGLWDNSEENQSLTGCLMISLIHSLLILNSCNFNYSRSKIQTYLLNITHPFKASLTLRLHSTEQYIHKHYTNYTIQKYVHRKITQCKLHAGMRPYAHNKYFNWLALNMIQRYNLRQELLKELRT